MLRQRVGRAFCFVFLAFMTSLVGASPSTTVEPLRIGVLAFRPKPETLDRWRPLADHLSQQLNGHRFVVEALTYPEMDAAVDGGKIDFVLTQPSHYVALTYRRPLSSPLATLVERDGEHTLDRFGGVIFTRADRNDINTLANLRGKTIATSSTSSLGSYQMQAFELARVGIRLPVDAQALVTGQPQDKAIDEVLAARADAGFVRTGVIEAMLREGKLNPNRLKIVDPQRVPGFPFQLSTRLFPEWPVAAMPDVEADVARHVAAALLSLPHDGEIARALAIQGFAVPGDYRPVDELLRELRLPPFDKSPRITLADVWTRYRNAILLLTLAGFALMLGAVIVLVRTNRKLRAEQARADTSTAEIERLVNYDTLTGFPNRTLLVDQIEQSMALGKRRGRQDMLILFNVDRFKTLNDARGSAMGDLMLMAVGGRLASLIRDGDKLARIAGDEFALLVQDIPIEKERASRYALVIAEKIHASLRLPFLFDEEEVTITATLGISFFPQDADDTSQEVMQRAQTALHRAKEDGGNQTAFFDSSMGALAQQRFLIERELRRGIPAGELRLFLQSQVDEQGKIVAAEVLVRWQHPQRGLLPPGVFIGVAEESDLIVELETWVLSEACRLIAEQDLAGRGLRLAVNVSPRHFRQTGFVQWIKDLLAAHGIDPSRLMLEVTEGMVIDNIGDVVAKMTELVSLGIRFSIDDFGTGYSSLAYLKRMPIQELKIDKSFVQDLPHDSSDAALVETILSVARHLQLHVVAEGVETQEQADFLTARAQLTLQGYLFSRPEPAADWLGRWIERRG